MLPGIPGYFSDPYVHSSLSPDLQLSAIFSEHIGYPKSTFERFCHSVQLLACKQLSPFGVLKLDCLLGKAGLPGTQKGLLLMILAAASSWCYRNGIKGARWILLLVALWHKTPLYLCLGRSWGQDRPLQSGLLMKGHEQAQEGSSKPYGQTHHYGSRISKRGIRETVELALRHGIRHGEKFVLGKKQIKYLRVSSIKFEKFITALDKGGAVPSL